MSTGEDELSVKGTTVHESPHKSAGSVLAQMAKESRPLLPDDELPGSYSGPEVLVLSRLRGDRH